MKKVYDNRNHCLRNFKPLGEKHEMLYTNSVGRRERCPNCLRVYLRLTVYKKLSLANLSAGKLVVNFYVKGERCYEVDALWKYGGA